LEKYLNTVSAPRHVFLLITGQLELRLGFGLVFLMLICGITTANGLP